ncbi:helix-turn-helix domain-containing protein [Rhodococcoides fascians]|uniref:helix-turn-helix domain-containing protein n=1 Tax=Rhodococcoides fascians TaxID=1828 RepID=UPI0009B8ED2E
MAHRTKSANPDDLMTVSQVAAHLQVSVRTVHRYLASGRIPKTVLPGGQARVRRGDMQTALSRPAAS